MNVREHHIIVYQQLRLKRKPQLSDRQTMIDLTHMKDLKDPGEVPVPTRDRIFVRLRMQTTRDRMPFTLFDDLLLDLGHRPAIETLVSGPLGVVHIGG